MDEQRNFARRARAAASTRALGVHTRKQRICRVAERDESEAVSNCLVVDTGRVYIHVRLVNGKHANVGHACAAQGVDLDTRAPVYVQIDVRWSDRHHNNTDGHFRFVDSLIRMQNCLSTTIDTVL